MELNQTDKNRLAALQQKPANQRTAEEVKELAALIAKQNQQ